MYVAEFRKYFNHHTGKSEWQVSNVYEDMKDNNWHKNIFVADCESSEGMRYAKEINPDTIAYKLIPEQDIAITQTGKFTKCMDCTVANSKFETYKDFI